MVDLLGFDLEHDAKRFDHHLHARLVWSMGFRVRDFGRIEAFGLRHLDFGYLLSGIGCRVSDFGLRLWGAGFGFRVSGFRFWTSDFGFRVSDLGFSLGFRF